MAEILDDNERKKLYRKMLAESATSNSTKKYSFNEFEKKLLNDKDLVGKIADIAVKRNWASDDADFYNRYFPEFSQKAAPAEPPATPVAKPAAVPVAEKAKPVEANGKNYAFVGQPQTGEMDVMVVDGKSIGVPQGMTMVPEGEEIPEMEYEGKMLPEVTATPAPYQFPERGTLAWDAIYNSNPEMGTPEYDYRIAMLNQPPKLVLGGGGYTQEMAASLPETMEKAKQSSLSPVFKDYEVAQKMMKGEVPLVTQKDVREAKENWNKMTKEQQQAAIMGGPGYEYEQEKKLKKIEKEGGASLGLAKYLYSYNTDFIQSILRGLEQGGAVNTVNMGQLRDAAQGVNIDEIPYKEIADANRRVKNLGQTQSDIDLAKKEGRIKDIWDVVKALPLVTLESLVSLGRSGYEEVAAGSAIGAGGGSVLPLAGTGAGALLGGTAGAIQAGRNLEYYSTLMQELEAKGVDITNPNELRKGLIKHGKKADDTAITRSNVIAAVETILPVAGQATKTVATRAIPKVLKKPLEITGKALTYEPVAGPLGGATGELAAQIASGQKIDPQAIALEAGGQGAATVAAAARAIKGEKKAPNITEFSPAIQESQVVQIAANSLQKSISRAEEQGKKPDKWDVKQLEKLRNDPEAWVKKEIKYLTQKIEEDKKANIDTKLTEADLAEHNALLAQIKAEKKGMEQAALAPAQEAAPVAPEAEVVPAETVTAPEVVVPEAPVTETAPVTEEVPVAEEAIPVAPETEEDYSFLEETELTPEEEAALLAQEEAAPVAPVEEEVVAEEVPAEEVAVEEAAPQAPAAPMKEVGVGGIIYGHEDIVGNKGLGDVRNQLPEENSGVIIANGKDGNQYAVAFSRKGGDRQNIFEQTPAARPGHIYTSVKIGDPSNAQEVEQAKKQAEAALAEILPTVKGGSIRASAVQQAITDFQTKKPAEPAPAPKAKKAPAPKAETKQEAPKPEPKKEQAPKTEAKPVAEKETSKVLQELGKRQVPEGKGSWRARFNKETDPFKKKDILRGIADSSNDINELNDIKKAAKGMPDDGNILAVVYKKLSEKEEGKKPTPKEEKKPITLNDIREKFGEVAYGIAKKQQEVIGEEFTDLNRVERTADRIIELGGSDKGAAVAEALLYEIGYPDNFNDLRNAIKKGGIELNSQAVERMLEVGVELPNDILKEFQNSNRYKNASPEVVSIVEKQVGKPTKKAEAKTEIEEPTKKGVRFEKGKKLTEEEKKEVYKNLKDSYKEMKRPYTIETRVSQYTGRDYEARVWLENASDYMQTSDVTGRKLRYYIFLPDGTLAHPTEIFPNISPSEMTRVQRNVEYNERQANEKMDDITSQLKKSGEIDKVVKAIETALKNGAEFVKEYDSGDVGQKNPLVMLRFPNGRKWGVPQYVINTQDSILGFTQQDVVKYNLGESREKIFDINYQPDWEQFYNNNKQTEAAPKEEGKKAEAKEEKVMPTSEALKDIDSKGYESQVVGPYVIIAGNVFDASKTQGRKWEYSDGKLISIQEKNKVIVKPESVRLSQKEAARLAQAYSVVEQVDSEPFKPIINYIAAASGMSATELLETFGKGKPITSSEYNLPFSDFEKSVRDILGKVKGLNDKISSAQIMEDYYLHHFGKAPSITKAENKLEASESIADFYGKPEATPSTKPSTKELASQVEDMRSLPPAKRKAAQQALEERYGKEDVEKMIEITANFTKIIDDLEQRGVVKIDCP